MHTQNRRRHPRVYHPVEVRYRYGDNSYMDITQSLSMGGLYIRTRQPLDIGSLFQVDFTLPDFDHLFQIRGLVIWQKEMEDVNGPPGMGVKFLNVSEEDKKALLRYLAGSQKTHQGY